MVVRMGVIDTSNKLNFTNLFVTIVHFNGTMTQSVKGVSFHFVFPEIFRIPYDCLLLTLKLYFQ